MSWILRVSWQPFLKSPCSLLWGWTFSGAATGVADLCLLHTGNSDPTAGRYSQWSVCSHLASVTSCDDIGAFLLEHKKNIIRSWKPVIAGYPDIHAVILALYFAVDEWEATGICDLRCMLQQIVLLDQMLLVSGFYFGLTECDHEAHRIKSKNHQHIILACVSVDFSFSFFSTIGKKHQSETLL